MKKRLGKVSLGAAAIAATLVFAGVGHAEEAVAPTGQASTTIDSAHASQVTDISARRRYRHVRHYRYYRPYYGYARPYYGGYYGPQPYSYGPGYYGPRYYRPGVNFGFGFGPVW